MEQKSLKNNGWEVILSKETEFAEICVTSFPHMPKCPESQRTQIMKPAEDNQHKWHNMPQNTEPQEHLNNLHTQ